MIETISNVLQFFATFAGFAFSVASYLRKRHRAYFPLICFYGCFAMAGLYWTLYLLLYQRTPQVVSVAYIGWNTSLIFLYILQDMLATKEEKAHKSRLCWLVPPLGLSVFAIICYAGKSISRLLACVLIIAIGWQAVRGLSYAGGRGNKRWLHIVLLLYAVTEYSLWTVACLLSGSGWNHPYDWIDFLLTAVLIAIFPAARKAVEA